MSKTKFNRVLTAQRARYAASVWEQKLYNALHTKQIERKFYAFLCNCLEQPLSSPSRLFPNAYLEMR